MRLRTIFGVSLAFATALGMSGCANSNQAASPSGSAAPAGKIKVFASTNVWGSIASAVGGDAVEVISAVDKPDLDPHGYEPSVANKADLSEAKLILMNGGGYDSWVNQLIESTGNKAPVINAVAVSGIEGAEEAANADHDHEHAEGEEGHDHDHEHAEGEEGHDHDHEHAEGEEGHDHDHEHAEGEEGHDHDHEEGEEGHEHHHHHHHHHHGGFNEHVFYSLHAAEHVAEAVADNLSKIDPGKKSEFQDNLKAFTDKIDSLDKRLEALAKKHPDVKVVATEPVAGYLLAELNVKDLTPEQFVEQSESEAGPSVQVLADTVKLLTDKQVNFLVLNAQTKDAVSEKLEKAAKDAGLSIVQVYESFPAGVNDYITWIDNTVTDLEAALS